MLVGDLSPHGWAVSVSYGVAAGLFPIIGPVSLVSLAVVWMFRLHLPLVMLLVYGLYPLQLILMVPLGIVGKFVLPAQSVASLNNTANLSWFYTLGDWALAAFLGWLMVIVPVGLLCYHIALKFAHKKKSALPSAVK